MVKDFPDLEFLLANDLEHLLKSVFSHRDLIEGVLSGFATSRRRIIVPDAFGDSVTFTPIPEILTQEINVCRSHFEMAHPGREPYHKSYYEQMSALISASASTFSSSRQSRQLSQDEVQLLFNFIQNLRTLNKQLFEKNRASAPSGPSLRLPKLTLETITKGDSSMRCHTLPGFFKNRSRVVVSMAAATGEEAQEEREEPPLKCVSVTTTHT